MKFKSIDNYVNETTVTYNGETYKVRDNGAICRLQKTGLPKRKFDDIWTFGNQDKTTGYMRFNGRVVHKIIATAFHGPQPSADHVVDHIDTNRGNNRAENLRWVTRFENILLNQKTLKSINQKWGSVAAMLNDPNRDEKVAPLTNRSWMPGFSYNNLIVDSLTPLAKQENWKTLNAFPLCPGEESIHKLWEYFSELKPGVILSHNKYGENIVKLAELSEDGSLISVVTKMVDGIKDYGHVTIRAEKQVLIHKAEGAFLTIERAIFSHKKLLEFSIRKRQVLNNFKQSFDECG